MTDRTSVRAPRETARLGRIADGEVVIDSAGARRVAALFDAFFAADATGSRSLPWPASAGASPPCT